VTRSSTSSPTFPLCNSSFLTLNWMLGQLPTMFWQTKEFLPETQSKESVKLWQKNWAWMKAQGTMWVKTYMTPYLNAKKFKIICTVKDTLCCNTCMGKVGTKPVQSCFWDTKNRLQGPSQMPKPSWKGSCKSGQSITWICVLLLHFLSW